MRRLNVILFSGLFLAQGASAFAKGVVANVKKEIKVLRRASTYHRALQNAADVHWSAMIRAKDRGEKEKEAAETYDFLAARSDDASSSNTRGPQLEPLNHNQAAETAWSLRDKLGVKGARAYAKRLVDSNQKYVERINAKSTKADAIAQVLGTLKAKQKSEYYGHMLSNARDSLKAAEVQKKILDRE